MIGEKKLKINKLMKIKIKSRENFLINTKKIKIIRLSL